MSLLFSMLFIAWAVAFGIYTIYSATVLLGNDLCICETVTDVNKIKPRVLNGSINGNNDLPFVASLYEKIIDKTKKDDIALYVYRSFCTGSIISNSFVLTSSHCFNRFEKNETDYRRTHFVTTGSSDLNLIYDKKDYYRTIKDYFKHPEYKEITLKNKNGEKIDSYFEGDIGLIQVNEPFNLGERTGIYPTCLLDKEMNEDDTLIVVGYGRFESNEKRARRIESEPDNFEIFDGKPKTSNSETHLLMTNMKRLETNDKFICKKNLICTRNQGDGICFADHGGPVAWFDKDTGKLYTVGVVSSEKENLDYDYRAKCNSVLRSTSVANYLDWIRGFVPDKARCVTGETRVKSGIEWFDRM